MKSTIIRLGLLVGAITFFSACEEKELTQGIVYQTDFQQDDDGWVVNYTDYSTQVADIDFNSAWTTLPQPLDTTRRSIRVSSMNRSDDVFMFLKKKLTNLQPNTVYQLVFDVELASQYATNSVGIGGSPGSSVYLKAGATAIEPLKVLDDTNFYGINIDKGNQSTGGKDALVLGNVGAGNDVEEYTLITRSNAGNPLAVQTNAQGELWLVVGTDSGYEGLTRLYYNRISVTAL